MKRDTRTVVVGLLLAVGVVTSGARIVGDATVLNAKERGTVRFHRAHGVALGTANSGSPALTGVRISGAQRLLVCVTSIEPRDSTTTVGSLVLDNGRGRRVQNLTRLGTDYSAPSDGLRWSTWYLVAPRQGRGRVLVSHTGPVLTSYLACVSYTGVDQASPFGTVSTVSGTTGAPELPISVGRTGGLPWAHLFSSNAGYAPGQGVADRQPTSSHTDVAFSSLTDAWSEQPPGSFTFTWDYSGQFGGQGATIYPAARAHQDDNSDDSDDDEG